MSIFWLCKKSVFKMHELYCWSGEPSNSNILEENLERNRSVVDKQVKNLWIDVLGRKGCEPLKGRKIIPESLFACSSHLVCLLSQESMTKWKGWWNQGSGPWRTRKMFPKKFQWIKFCVANLMTRIRKDDEDKDSL